MTHCKHSKPTDDVNCRKCELDKSLHYGSYSCYCIFYELSLWNKITEWLYDRWQKLRVIVNNIIQ